MLRKEDIFLIIYFILVIFFLAAFTIVFFVVYQKRKNKLLQERLEAEQRFRDELNTARLEIQEATLKNVSWELHDNIGQLLAVASMQLKLLQKKQPENTGIEEVHNLVSDSLTEVRALSRSLNNEVIEKNGLVKTVQNELDRFNRLEVLQAELQVKGEPFQLKQEDAIILFRILQESFSNTLKHSGASQLNVLFEFSEDTLEITARDNGKGYEQDGVETGAGLLNMKSRAAMIHAEISMESSENTGTSLYLRYLNMKNLP
ncbi:MAG: histidine kinase [Gramella sp.]|nr:histidine kinase [Christiangramia sp.]MAM19228.1 histidine kinase [Christiangramia sp.]